MNMSRGDLMKRWNRIKTKYIETKAYWNRTGAGLMPGDEFRTIEEIKEGMCPRFKELDSIYGEKPNIKALSVHDSMLMPKSTFDLSANSFGSNFQTSQGSNATRSNAERRDVNFRTSQPQDTLMTSNNQEEGRKSTSEDSSFDPESSRGVGIGRPIPTFVGIDDQANWAAQQALFDFDYTPNTYNFARETYDFPHDTYDFDSDTNSKNHESSHLDENYTTKEVDNHQIEMSNTPKTAETGLNRGGFERSILDFEQSEARLQELGLDRFDSPVIQREERSESGMSNLSLPPKTDLPGPFNDINEVVEVVPPRVIDEQVPPVQSKSPSKPKSKKAQRAALNLATRAGAPLPALNAEEVRRKKPIESALKQSNQDRFVFFERQMALKEQKELQRTDRMAEQANHALDWEREKFERESERLIRATELLHHQQERARELVSDRALLLAQNQTASEERRERREVIKDCQKNKMSIAEIKEYLALMFPETE